MEEATVKWPAGLRWVLISMCVLLAIVSNALCRIGAIASDGGSRIDKYYYGVPWVYMEVILYSDPATGVAIHKAAFQMASWHTPWCWSYSHIYTVGLGANVLWWSAFLSCCCRLIRVVPGRESKPRFQFSIAHLILLTVLVAMLLSSYRQW